MRTASILVAALLPALASLVDACTLVMIGKDATADGSIIVAHTDDAGGSASDIRLVRVPAADWPKGSKRAVYKFEDGYPRLISKYRGKAYYPQRGANESIILGYIPQVEHTYGYMDQDYGLINDQQLIIAETTTSAKTAGWPVSDPWGKAMFGIDELSKVALERCDSARCAVQLMGDLAYKYGFWSADSGDPKNPGYADSSETLGVGDKYGEVWVFHVLTGKNGSSAVWAAQRIPDNHVAVSANSFIIRQMDLSDSDNFLASPNIHSLAQEEGWWNPEEEEFDFFKAYGFGTVDDVISSLYTGRRHWRLFDYFAPSLRLDPYWGVTPDRPSYPFSIQPDTPISVPAVMKILRDRFEGTEFDQTKGLAAGPFSNPIRWDGWGHNIKGGWERQISIYRATFSFVAQARPNLPDEIGGIAWYGHDTPNGTVYQPVYGSQNELPPSWLVGKMTEFNQESAWWAFNFVNNWRLIRFDAITPDIVKEQERLEARAFKLQEEAEEEALDACGGRKKSCANSEKAISILQKFSVDNAEYVTESWWKLAWSLVSKYTNGYMTTGERAGQQRALGYPAWWLNLTDFAGWPHHTYYYRDQEPSWGIHLPAGMKWEEKQPTAADGTSSPSIVPPTGSRVAAGGIQFGSFVLGALAAGIVFVAVQYFLSTRKARRGYVVLN